MNPRHDDFPFLAILAALILSGFGLYCWLAPKFGLPDPLQQKIIRVHER